MLTRSLQLSLSSAPMQDSSRKQKHTSQNRQHLDFLVLLRQSVVTHAVSFEQHSLMNAGNSIGTNYYIGAIAHTAESHTDSSTSRGDFKYKLREQHGVALNPCE